MKPLSREARIGIYANAYHLRLVESLSLDFEVTARAVREEMMGSLVYEYLQKFPSRYRTINEVGRYFPKFLKKHQIARHLPFLPDVAEMERLMLESHFADDSTPLSETDIAAMAPRMETHVLHLDPAVRLMASHWNIHQVWERREANDKKFFQLPPKERTHLMIWRQGGMPQLQIVEGPAYKLLHLIRRGLKFGRILDDMKQVPNLETRLQTWFQDWMKKGLFVKWEGKHDGHRALPLKPAHRSHH